MYDNLTKSDIQKMEEEIEHRKLVVRKEAIEAVKEARAFGDLSENFEYYAAKQAKNQNESRIRYLENMIKTANIIEDRSADDEVGINKRVEILFEDDDETEEYKIVTSVRGDSLEGRITPESPLGAALMGHKAGERVEVKVDAKDHSSSYYIKILKVENTGEEEADVLRSF
jgi:transcription elongation factor GreA